MISRFGRGRAADTPHSDEEPLSASEAAADSSEVTPIPADDELPRPPDTAPVRPDLGPPAPGPQSANQPGSGLGLIISVAIASIVFVLAIYGAGSPTANPLPLAQTTNTLYWAVGVIAITASAIGAEYADRTASRAHDRPRLDTSPMRTAWIVPAIATATAVVLVATFHNSTMIAVGPLIAFLGSAGSLLSRDLLDDADDSAQRTATTIHTLVIHAIAFLALSAIYLNKLPTPLTALLAAIVTVLLVLEALERSSVSFDRKLTYAVLAGGAVAAAAAPLMWWLTHGWTGGAVLFVVFYCAAGIVQAAADRRPIRLRDAIEFGLVPLAAFLVLAITA
jgi:hypothetical protein